ncbi:MAG: hypothetical protein ACLPYZ_11035 [Limisphaerales bacterium]
MKEKKCHVCGRVKLTTEFYSVSAANRARGGTVGYCCKDCKKRIEKERHEKHCRINPEYEREKRNRWASSNREKQRAAGKKHRLKIRAAVISAYGGKCKCCGEATMEFLSIDHIDGGGKAHRAATHGHTYADLFRRKFPKGYQVLCHNCNLAKGFYGICPHQKQH